MIYNSDDKLCLPAQPPADDRIATGIVVMEDPYRRANHLRTLRDAETQQNSPDHSETGHDR